LFFFTKNEQRYFNLERKWRRNDFLVLAIISFRSFACWSQGQNSLPNCPVCCFQDGRQMSQGFTNNDFGVCIRVVDFFWQNSCIGLQKSQISNWCHVTRVRAIFWSVAGVKRWVWITVGSVNFRRSPFWGKGMADGTWMVH